MCVHGSSRAWLAAWLAGGRHAHQPPYSLCAGFLPLRCSIIGAESMNYIAVTLGSGFYKQYQVRGHAIMLGSFACCYS